MPANPSSGRRIRLLASLLSVLILAAACGAAWFYGRLRASLPQLDGAARIPGLTAPVAVERDDLGVPTIHSANRRDAARALGFLHAQDRFFQMDLLRRRAAGELAEIFGKSALPIDRAARRHGFRALARQVLARARPEERAVVEAYAAGVNAGLAALKAIPFEYYVLRAEPRPWKAEDCVLVAYAMAMTLQARSAPYEESLSALRDAYGPRAVAFFDPLVGPSDAALDGSTGPLPPIPGPAVINLRPEKPEPVAADLEVGRGDLTAPLDEVEANGIEADRPSPGSNAFAISGAHTTTGAGLLANDMHLDLAVPNIWYRASLRIASSASAPAETLTGITLPGTPFLVAGSNGRIAWGFTTAFADTVDLVVVMPTEDPALYHGPPPGPILPIEERRDSIRVKGSKPVPVTSEWTIWGPIVGHDAEDRPLALHWTLYDPTAANFRIMGLESAGTVDQALAVAHDIGLPALNFVVADSSGRIAWTVAGRLPKRVGYDGRLATRWDFGDRRWDGFLPAAEIPTLNDPARGAIWSSNSRMLGGKALGLLGDGGYERPARQAQVRDDLQALLRGPGAKATPADLLSIQLDDHARFLSRWRDLFLRVLSPEAVAGNSSRARLRAALASWDGRAGIDSAGYRLVRSFRLAVLERILNPIFAPCVAIYPRFDWDRFHYEDAVWAMIQAEPMHLLAPAYAGWDDLLLASADDVAAELRRDGLTPASATWGLHNTLRMNHPFARVFPAFLTGWLAMPAEQLPGDTDMPRVQSPTFGASARFVVSPGHEADGIYEMPGGQSGHPLSPFFRAGHEAWAHGLPAKFLPGPPAHHLILTAE